MLKAEQIPDAVIDVAVAMRDRGGSMRRNKPSEGWFGPYLILPLTQENTNAET